MIGNFQKDGDGWFGNNPKLIKGPDIFLKVIKILKDKIPNLYIFLTGPSRGYTKIGLRKMGVPFYHRYFRSYEDIIKSYKSLDTYLFCSREEGVQEHCWSALLQNSNSFNKRGTNPGYFNKQSKWIQNKQF